MVMTLSAAGGLAVVAAAEPWLGCPHYIPAFAACCCFDDEACGECVAHRCTRAAKVRPTHSVRNAA